MIRPVYSQRAMKSPYWNEALETMPRQELDALHLRRLQSLIKYAYQNIPMYREIYDEAGVRPEEIRTLDDYVEKLPAIDKQHVLKYQLQAKAAVPGAEEYISFLYQTSGTTGKPLMEPGHFPDIINMWTYQWWAHGIRPRDVFYFAFPFGTFMAFWSAYFDAHLLGAQVISGGGVDSKARIYQIQQFRPTVLISTPTYALRLAEVATEMGADSRATSIRFISTAGEPGSMVPGLRRAMEQAWNAKAIDLYGISELWGSTSWECPLHTDRMHLGESTAHGIVVDDKGRLVPNGGKGEFVLTNYEATIQPLIKYRTHDVVEWHKEPCDCGRSWLWLRGGVLARTDQMVTIKGTNVYPTSVQALLGEVKGLSERMEIHIDREEGNGVFDRVCVKVEPSPEVDAGKCSALKVEAEGLLRARVGVSIPVEVVPPMSLPRYELKAKLVFDHRSKGVG
ncbi:MAG: AMP-binding protein [Deltaproteobacteria bacterium]|nr:AMP-binding protein [Deltaproteobacteria bacterium]